MLKNKRWLAWLMAVCCFLTMSFGSYAAKVINVSYQGNGGEFVVGPENFSTSGYGFDIESGKTTKDAGVTINDPVFWNPSRAFLGWEAGYLAEEADDEGNIVKKFKQFPGTGLLTSAQAMNYVLPEKDEVMFYAKWDGEDKDYYTQVYIDGYGAEFQFQEIYWDDVTNQNAARTVSTGCWGNQLKKNNTSIQAQTKDYQILLTEPTRPDAAFEGWLEFKNLYGKDEDGGVIEYTELVSDTIYTTQQMLTRPVPSAYDVRYVAKWSDIAAEDYYQPVNEYNVQFDGCGGMFEVLWQGKSEGPQEGWGMGCRDGKTSLNQGFNILSDPVFWDPSRPFLGWIVGSIEEYVDEEGNLCEGYVQLENTSLMTTAEALNYTIPEKDIIFRARWDGLEQDYYSDVNFDGCEGAFVIDLHESEDTWVTETTEYWGNFMKEAQSGETIGDQAQSFMRWKQDPQKGTAVFEGWLEFKEVAIANEDGSEFYTYELVSDKLYTTAEVMAKMVPDYNVTYGAKWSDIPLEDYINSGNNGGGGTDYYAHFIGFNANGGELAIMFTDENGQLSQATGESSNYWMQKDKSVAEQMDENGDGFMYVRKDCAEFLGWKVYEFTGFDWVDMPKGQELNVGDPDVEFVFFAPFLNENTGVEYDRYLGMHTPKVFKELATIDEMLQLGKDANYFVVAQWEEHVHPNRVMEAQAVVKPTADKAGSYDEVYICRDCGQEMERVNVALTVDVQQVQSGENEAPMQVEVQSALVEIPETVQEQYENLTDVQMAMAMAAIEENPSFDKDGVLMLHMDVELKVQTADGSWEKVNNANFPEEGIEFLLPYPEGADAENYEFVVTHMITEGERAGEIEILPCEPEADGLRVKVTSLSPISVSAKKAAEPVTEVFADVHNDWYTSYVQFVYDTGLMTGIKGTNQFAPNANITKAQVAQVLYNMTGQPIVDDQKVFNELKDVYASEWYADAVAWAYNTGVVTGDLNSKKFNPNADVSREQLAIMMYRYAAHMKYDTSATSDLKGLKNAENTANWALEGVKWAVGAGLISGIDTNGVKDLAPQGNASRAQMAAILQRFCEN